MKDAILNLLIDNMIAYFCYGIILLSLIYNLLRHYSVLREIRGREILVAYRSQSNKIPHIILIVVSIIFIMYVLNVKATKTTAFDNYIAEMVVIIYGSVLNIIKLDTKVTNIGIVQFGKFVSWEKIINCELSVSEWSRFGNSYDLKFNHKGKRRTGHFNIHIKKKEVETISEILKGYEFDLIKHEA